MRRVMENTRETERHGERERERKTLFFREIFLGRRIIALLFAGNRKHPSGVEQSFKESRDRGSGRGWMHKRRK